MSQEFTIGREDARSADILLPGNTISSIHAKIGIDATGRLWIADNGSRNGTELLSMGMSRKIGSTPEYVNSGDSLIFGGVEYSVDKLFSLLPNLSPQPVVRDEVTQATIRCRHCGSPTPAGRACIKCGR